MKKIINDLNLVAKWFKTSIENLDLDVNLENINNYKKQIEEMLFSYPNFPKDQKRTKIIINLLKQGEEIFPIYVDAKDNFILEGRHRIVAFSQLGIYQISVVKVKKKKY